MIIKQIAIDEALELHKRGLMVGVLQPVVPEPKNLDDYEFLTSSGSCWRKKKERQSQLRRNWEK